MRKYILCSHQLRYLKEGAYFNPPQKDATTAFI